MFLRLVFALSAVPLLTSPARADDARDLLSRAVAHWAEDFDRWSFVQQVREYKDDRVCEVREERFDPAQPDSHRWELLSIDGRAPDEAERRAFAARKNAKPRRRLSDPVHYIDFDGVRVRAENTDSITLDVPLRGDLSLFVPFEAIAARVEIDRSTGRIRRLEVGLAHEMRIAFGLVRVTDLALDFCLPTDGHTEKDATSSDELRPEGRAWAVMTKLGRRAEISWSGFRRVNSD